MGNPKMYWVGFNYVKGIGAVRFNMLLSYFGDAQSAWNASAEDLRQSGLSSKLVDNFLQIRSQINLDQVWEKIHLLGIRVLTLEDDGYPRRLKEIDQPPPTLYLRGQLTDEDDWAVAIVGTRRMTAYGRQVTEEVTAALVRNGITIVSGMARGIDGIAHQAAITAGGRTLAVLGCGVDRIYPPEHQRLAEQIIQNGALISDYPPGTPPDAINFPPRNRIISGLSKAVVIVEAGVTSGALITGQFAADQGKDVFAVPGNIFALQSKGPNRLLRDGAHPLLEPDDILRVLDLSNVIEQRAAREVLPSNVTEAQLLSLLSHEPVHIDDLQASSGLPIEQISATLVMMELKGMVRQVGGMNYVAIRELPADYNLVE